MSTQAITPSTVPHDSLRRADLGRMVTVTRPTIRTAHEQSATGVLVGVKYAPDGTYLKLSLWGIEATIHLATTDELRFMDGN